MASTHRERLDSPIDRWLNQTSVGAKPRPLDLDQDQDNDRLSRQRSSLGIGRLRTLVLGTARLRALVPFIITFCIGVAATLAWQSLRNPSPDLQQLRAMSLDLATMRQSVDQLTAQHRQMAGDIATLQAAQQAILRKVSGPAPRQAAAPARNAGQN